MAVCTFAAAGSTRTTPGIAQAKIEYRGELIRLSRAYFDYDDYKNDPNNIHPEETVRVQALVKGAPVARSYPDRKSLFRALSELPFPGYGSGAYNGPRQSDGTMLLLYSLEIPRADASRYLVFRERGGTYALVDDFVAPDAEMVSGVRDVPEGLEYSHSGGKLTVRKPAGK